MPPVAESFGEKLKRLTREQGTSIAKAYDAARWDGPGEKPSKAALDQALQGRRPLTVRLIALMADGLGVPPGTFEEYLLAQARAALDEREVGLEAAVANLAKVRGALGLEPREPAPGEDEETLRLAAGEEIEHPGERDAEAG